MNVIIQSLFMTIEFRTKLLESYYDVIDTNPTPNPTESYYDVIDTNPTPNPTQGYSKQKRKNTKELAQSDSSLFEL